MGYMMPIGITECLPGDTFQQATSVFLRCSPLVTPVMHPVHVTVHHWFIPTRLLWDKWEDFITGDEQSHERSAWHMKKNRRCLLERITGEALRNADGHHVTHTAREQPVMRQTELRTFPHSIVLLL